MTIIQMIVTYFSLAYYIILSIFIIACMSVMMFYIMCYAAMWLLFLIAIVMSSSSFEWSFNPNSRVSIFHIRPAKEPDCSFDITVGHRIRVSVSFITSHLPCDLICAEQNHNIIYVRLRLINTLYPHRIHWLIGVTSQHSLECGLQ